MFDVTLPSGESWRESAAFAGGDTLVVVDTPLGRLGLSICYDLRFPELYRALVDRGATLLAIPAAFTVSTGEAHWHPLLRARAIGTGCFVLAAAHAGGHDDGRTTYGHRLAVDQRGAPLAEITQERRDTAYRLVPATVDGNRVKRHHTEIPHATSRSTNH